MYIYIYIYIHILYTYTYCIYIYIYIHTCSTCVCVFVFVCVSSEFCWVGWVESARWPSAPGLLGVRLSTSTQPRVGEVRGHRDRGATGWIWMNLDDTGSHESDESDELKDEFEVSEEFLINCPSKLCAQFGLKWFKSYFRRPQRQCRYRLRLQERTISIHFNCSRPLWSDRSHTRPTFGNH